MNIDTLSTSFPEEQKISADARMEVAFSDVLPLLTELDERTNGKAVTGFFPTENGWEQVTIFPRYPNITDHLQFGHWSILLKEDEDELRVLLGSSSESKLMQFTVSDKGEKRDPTADEKNRVARALETLVLNPPKKAPSQSERRGFLRVIALALRAKARGTKARDHDQEVSV
jgi:hypothetical protein